MVNETDKIDTIRSIAEPLVGSPYVFGSWGTFCSPSEREKRAKYSPKYSDKIRKYCPVLSGKQTVCGGCQYNGRRAFDCRGLTDYVLKTAGIIDLYGDSVTTQYNTSSNWSQKGLLTDAPDVPCYVLFRKDSGNRYGHTGLYLDGYAIHAKGHAYGVVRESVGKLFTHYAIPANLYEEIPTVRVLRKGCSGDDVKELQRKLNALGYSLAEDGVYGTQTVHAVTMFQASALLDTDGIAGKLTMEALNASIPDDKPAVPAFDIADILARLEKLERTVYGYGAD